jgi:hypothetical protein
MVIQSVANVAQLVEQRFRKARVAGSSPVVGSINGMFWNTRLALIMVVAAVAGCASQPQPNPKIQAEGRRQAYVKSHPDISDHIKQVILRGSFEPGMTEGEVIASLGLPKGGINTTSTPGHTHEQWIYGTSSLYFDNGILTGYQK